MSWRALGVAFEPEETVREPDLALLLFSDRRTGVLWLVPRLVAAWWCLQVAAAGLADPAWSEFGWSLPKAVTVTELALGLALLAGAFTGIAAFLSAFLSSGALVPAIVASNPVVFLVALLLMLAWKNAGWIGCDRWLLPSLGTPWSSGPESGPR